MSSAMLAMRNVLKAWLLVIGICGVLGFVGWALGGYRLLSIFVFCGLLLAAAAYWYADRVAPATPAELEGLLAHELAHVRHRDVLVQTSVVVLAAALVEMSRIGGWLERALLFVLGPVAAAFVHLLLSPKREFAADRLAAEMCDSPH